MTGLFSLGGKAMKKLTIYWLVIIGMVLYSRIGIVRAEQHLGFEIIEWHLERNKYTGTLWVIGEIKNNNSLAMGVQLQAIVRDEQGRLIDSKDFWPASVKNIPAGGSWPIKSPITKKRGTVHLRIIDTTIW